MDNKPAPILHSMPKDTTFSAKQTVGSFNVSSEEALLLAKMQNESSKKRKFNIITIVAMLILALSITMLLIPDKYFIRKDTGINPPERITNFLNAENFYQIEKPTDSELDNFKSKQFANINGVSTVYITNGTSVLNFNELAPFLNDRFITALLPGGITDYLYGFVNVKNKSVPYIAFIISDQDIVNDIMLSLERTMYTDLATPLKLVSSKENELLQFENYDSIRLPTRYLRNLNNESLIMYGFPMDNVLLVTTGPDAYEALKNRMLLGY